MADVRKSKLLQKQQKLQKEKSKLENPQLDIQWDDKREKPNVNDTYWLESEEVSDLQRYIDWHRRHPHCVTPRLMKPGEDMLVTSKGQRYIDEENPRFIYTTNGIKANPVPPEFTPTKFGGDGEMDTVSVSALSKEHEYMVQYVYENDDPWFAMSVKDELEQSHIDGSHTTVKTRKSQQSKLSQFDRMAAWQEKNYGDYEGGYPTLNKKMEEKLELLTLQDKALLQDAKHEKKLQPWQNTRIFSKFTAEGTFLDEYKAIALKRRITHALKMYEKEKRIGTSRSSKKSSKSGKKKSTKSSKSSGKKPSSASSSRKSAKVVPVVDQYDEMKEKLGDDKHIDKMTDKWIALAKTVAKKGSKHHRLFVPVVDLVEACERLKYLKVIQLLRQEEANPNMKTAEEEPLFLHLITRAIKLDSISGHTGANDHKKDNPERKKLQKILKKLVQYKVDLDDSSGKEGYAAVHLAAIANNIKLVVWLAHNGANLELLSVRERMSPLMFAAKYGYIHLIADMIQLGVNMNQKSKRPPALIVVAEEPSYVKKVVDPNEAMGTYFTALHCTGHFGQTRSALFLLRVGADKRAQDSEGRTPAQIAFEKKFMATAQAISAFAEVEPSATAQLEYLVGQEKRDKKTRESRRRRNAVPNIQNRAQEAASGVMEIFHNFYNFVRNYFKKEEFVSSAEVAYDSDFSDSDSDEDYEDFDNNSEAGEMAVVPFDQS